MAVAVRRQIGGTSSIWGGRCVPYDPVDFDPRPFVPDGRWPLDYASAAAYHARAAAACRIGEAVFDAHAVPEIATKSIVPGLPDGDVLSTSLERWSLPTDFGKVYREELARSPRLRVVHGLTIVHIACAADRARPRVDHLVGKTLDGKTVTLRGEHVVLALGGVETTRLLLASDDVFAGGVGNHADHLGRWYMGHISGRIARVRFTTPPRATAYGFDRDVAGVYLRRRFSIARETQLRDGLLNIVSWLVNPTIGDPAHQNGVLSFAFLALAAPVLGARFAPAAIRAAALEGAPPGAWRAHLANIARDLPRTLAFIPSFGWRRFLAERRVPGFFQYSADNVYDLHYHGEQVPQRESRIVLADAVDALGLRRVELRLRYAEQDVDTVLRAHDLWDAWLRRHRVGHLETVVPDRRAAAWEQAGDGFHQCGTTRMSARPEDGVVDAHAAVHGFADLHVAGSSIFPTSGQANSTFLAVALGLRLADRLRARLAAPAVASPPAAPAAASTPTSSTPAR
ncbi:MAG: GMC family oxidoreductase [Myxococcota bacterium]